MEKNAILVCFTGIDGSGKTTLSKELADSLSNNGFKFRYVYARFEPFILKPFMLIARKIVSVGKSSSGYAAYWNRKREFIKKHKILSRTYEKILLLDYLMQLLLKVKVPLFFRTNIICDRYVYDTVIDLSIDFDYTKSERMDLLNKCFRIIPKPNIAFLIDIAEEVAYQRKFDVPCLEYLKKRRETYLDIARECGTMVLDGTKELNELRQDARLSVFQRIPLIGF